MDKLIITTETVEKKVHKFFCDECGTFLGESVEHDDGYFEKFGVVPRGNMSQDDHVLGIHVKLMQDCLCDNCLEKKKNDVRDALVKLGFFLKTKRY